ncbi:MAG: prephenate dehydrogenase/arogenate dehydrogenase family protein [Longimicrobiales bacterium]
MKAPGGPTVGIVGLGLLGGSLARDLAAAGWRVQGADRDPETERRARESGVVAGTIDPGAVDVIVLAVPVRAIPTWIRTLAPELAPDTVVTDVGSTKRSVVEAAEAAGLGPRFVGSHPMAGDHRSGWTAARTGLFGGAAVWTCPTGHTDPAALSSVTALWRGVGAEPRVMDATDHDRLLARSSHLPQLVASALASALARDGVTPGDLGPGGHDMTRLAGSHPAMWADILADNHDEVGAALAQLQGVLKRVRRAVGDRDDATLRSLLGAANAWARGEADPETAAAGPLFL